MPTRRPGEDTTTAAEMARLHGIDPKRFRAALRRAGLQWHSHNERWEVGIGSPERQDMERILAALAPVTTDAPTSEHPRTGSTSSARVSSDEGWIVDLCDAVLGKRAIRQHRFPFLLGDPGASGRRALLPVDAFYPDIGLVIEYHERQHSQRVRWFDDRPTVSGLGRGEQRRRYDDYRRTLLPEHGYALVIFDYSEFEHTAAGRLLRTYRDREIITARLRDHANRTVVTDRS
ncbi:MAG: hypothetical protein AB7I59_11330 [Geminicoccaceae bacterium]